MKHHLRILEGSKCYIGTQNPNYHISDESFCRTMLNRSPTLVRKYSAMALLNFSIIGFSKKYKNQLIHPIVIGVVLSFIVYFVQKFSKIGQDDHKVQRKI